MAPNSDKLNHQSPAPNPSPSPRLFMCLQAVKSLLPSRSRETRWPSQQASLNMSIFEPTSARHWSEVRGVASHGGDPTHGASLARRRETLAHGHACTHGMPLTWACASPPPRLSKEVRSALPGCSSKALCYTSRPDQLGAIPS